MERLLEVPAGAQFPLSTGRLAMGAADGGAVGVCLPGGDGGGFRGDGEFGHDGVAHLQQRWKDASGGAERSECMGTVRHARERVGVVRGLVRCVSKRFGGGSEGVFDWLGPRRSRRLVGQQRPLLSFVRPVQRRPGLPPRQPGSPRRLAPSSMKGASSWNRVKTSCGAGGRGQGGGIRGQGAGLGGLGGGSPGTARPTGGGREAGERGESDGWSERKKRTDRMPRWGLFPVKERLLAAVFLGGASRRGEPGTEGNWSVGGRREGGKGE